MNFAGKTALITGASRGIGRAIALEFAQQGVKRLILVARNAQRLQEVAADLQPYDVDVIPLILDLTQSTEVTIAMAQTWRDHGPIHILVNCAGVAHQSWFPHSRPQDIHEELMVNLMGLYSITRLISRRMISQQEGLIVNVSSLMGRLAAPTMATYSATKFAIVGFTEALRNELRPHGIRVVALLPSLTDTDMVQDMTWFRWVLPLSPTQVAQALIQGLNRGSREILVGWQSHLAVWGYRLAPGLMQELLRWCAPSSPSASPRRKPRRTWAALR